MREAIKLDTLLVASVAANTALIDTSASKLLMIATWLYGDDLWIHELAHKGVMNKVREEAYRQFPLLPRTIDKSKLSEITDEIVRTYGPTIMVRKGPYTRRVSPIQTLKEKIRGKLE